MAFVSGPRQVGKAEVAKGLLEVWPGSRYANWDDLDSRSSYFESPASLRDWLRLEDLSEDRPLLAFDELHKAGDRKNLLKGFFDLHSLRSRFLVALDSARGSRWSASKRGPFSRCSPKSDD